MGEIARDHDFDLLERFQGVSAEFVRLSLLGIGAVGLLFTLEPGKQPAGLASPAPKICFGIALFVLGLSAAMGRLPSLLLDRLDGLSSCSRPGGGQGSAR